MAAPNGSFYDNQERLMRARWCPARHLDERGGDDMADVQKILESLNQEERVALERALKGAAGEQRNEEAGKGEEGCYCGHHHHHHRHHCGCHHHHHHCCCC